MLWWSLISWGGILVAFVVLLWRWRAEQELRRKRERLRAWIEQEYRKP